MRGSHYVLKHPQEGLIVLPFHLLRPFAGAGGQIPKDEDNVFKVAVSG